MIQNLKNKNIKFSKKNKNCDFNSLFYPSSIAVVGASENIEKIGGFIFSSIKKNNPKIKLYPINVKSEIVQGIKAYKNLGNIRKKVDLVIIAIPKNFVIQTLKDCAKYNIKNVVIITAGFKESDNQGKLAEEEIKKIISENNINLIGPNCLGFLNSEINLNCSFAKECSKSGDITLISQSGAVIDAIIDWSFKQNIGFSKIVSLGNMAGINSTNILEYLKNDKKTNAVVFYLETLIDAPNFAKNLKEISKKKPVIIIKPGNSKSAKEAIGSHTGSLAGDSILTKTLIEENNGILVESLDELYNVLIGLKSHNLPKKPNTVILTNAGGPGVITTDAIENSNFKLKKFNESDKKKFDFLPSEASINNPIDILGDATSNRYKLALEELIKMKDVDNICVLLTPQIMTDSLNIAKIIAEVSKKTNKCIFTCFLGYKEIRWALDYLNARNVANFSSPNQAIIAMNYLLKYSSFKDLRKNLTNEKNKPKFNQNKIKRINSILENKSGLLDFELTKEILKTFDLKLPKKEIFRKKSDILDKKFSPNKTYVLKVDSIDLIHKKDVGGVRVGIKSHEIESVLHDMFDKLEKITNNFTINLEEEYLGTEVIVGLKKDLALGNFIMFGAGGTFVNLIKDINFSTTPINYNIAKNLVESSKINQILKGYRGSKPINYEKLYDVLIKISYIQEIFPQIKEVDFNPIICNEKDIYLVDVKLII